MKHIPECVFNGDDLFGCRCICHLPIDGVTEETAVQYAQLLALNRGDVLTLTTIKDQLLGDPRLREDDVQVVSAVANVLIGRAQRGVERIPEPQMPRRGHGLIAQDPHGL